MLIYLRRAVALSVVLIVLCLAYTGVETAIGQIFFQHQADGSLTAHGSTAIGQSWTAPHWFVGRDDPDDPAESGPTNYGPRSLQLYQQVKEREAQLRKYGITPTNDLVTGSGSGIDPDITPADANAQVDSVARADHLSVASVRKLVTENTAGYYLGIFGSPYVNVLQLNLALEKLEQRS